jgi:hypothetical protein
VCCFLSDGSLSKLCFEMLPDAGSSPKLTFCKQLILVSIWCNLVTKMDYYLSDIGNELLLLAV